MARSADPKALSRLLEAAQGVFVQKGLDRAKVEDITKRAGLSKGAFYLHFKTKEAAFMQLVSAMLQAMGRIALDTERCHGARESGHPPTFLKEWLDRDTELFEFVWQNRELMRLVLDGGGSADQRHLIDDFATHAQEVSTEFLRAGVEVGFYREDLDVVTAATFIAGGYDRFARQLVRERKKPNIRARIAQLQQIAVMGVGGQKLVSAVSRKDGQRKVRKPKQN